MSSKKLNYQGQAFSDGDLQDLPLKEVVYPYEEVNFSQNRLSAEGLRKVLELCSRCEKLRVLKLYKNDINDDAAQALSRFVRKCETLEELHLSHNRFTERGVEMLVKAAEEARSGTSVPMWTRLEQNDVAHPEKVIEDLQNRFSVCARKNRNKCSNRVCYYQCKVHLPHFHFQRDEFGQANSDGPRKRKFAPPEPADREDVVQWKDTDWREGRDDWFDGCPEAFRKAPPEPEWEEPAKKKWREESWDGADPRPSGVKMSGGIFMRAMGAIVSKKGDDDDGSKPDNEPAKPSRPPRVLPNNVASRTLSQMGVLGGGGGGGEPRRKGKVQLKEAPRGQGGIKKEDEMQEMEDDEDDEDEEVEEAEEASDAEKEAEEEEEMEDEEEPEPKKQGKTREDDRYSRRPARRGMHADRQEEDKDRLDRRHKSPPRRERREAEGRGAPRDREMVRRSRRRHEGRPSRREEADRRHGERDRGDRRRREDATRREGRDRSRRRAPRHRSRSHGEERRARGQEDASRLQRREGRAERGERDRARRRASAGSDRMVAGERTEKLLEKMQGSRREKGQREAATKAPESQKVLTKQEPSDANKQQAAVPFVATRAKAAPRRPQQPQQPQQQPPATPALGAPRPKVPAKPAAAKSASTAPKAAAKAVGDGNESEYTYTEASEYTYEDVEEGEEEEEEAVEVEDEDDDDDDDE